MKRSPLLIAIIYFWIAAPVHADVSIQAAYTSALEKTETTAIQAARTGQSRALLSQTQGGVFPAVSLYGNYTKQDAVTGSITSSTQRTDQTTSKIAINQPLFRGLREFAAIRGAKADVRAQEALSEQARLSLYANVSQSYYDVLAAEQDMKDLQTLEDLTKKRIKELAGRSKIGRSRQGEVLSAEAQLATIRAQLDAARAQIEISRNRFSYTTGLPKNSSLIDITNVPTKLRELQYYYNQLEARPDIVALREQLESAEEAVSVARGGHWPTIDFNGNYYLKRTGSLESSKWDAGLTFNLPIFQGGAIQAQVELALERSRERELTLAQFRRQALSDLSTYHRSVASGIEQIESLTQALEISERNYRGQTRDYGYGLVTNLEVLQALNSFLDTKRSLDRARYQTLSAWASLAAASNTVQELKKE